MSKRDIQISKSLSYLLRHGALKEKLPIDANGYVPLQVLLAHNRLKSHRCTLEDVHRIVDSNEKKRFHTKVSSEGQELICATQGHSIKSVLPTEDVLHEIRDPKELPPKLVHGTTVHNALLILQSGAIKKLRRNHVHLSPGVTGVDAAVVSGMRATSNVHIYIKLGSELLEQMKVYKSLNNVYLVPDDVPIALFDKLTIRPLKQQEKMGEELSELLQLLKDHQIHFEFIQDA
ncbi:hypothetical protein ZYGR_0H01150 [Zygosaccharomyces rouxii]|uniref:2'-phosphotransferase n=2 Tax=Zygosaccharomyces rouxii TaxID=4956 RepID=C5DR95_ZYGRC|nr:uncharacterized protein ZYRO0B06600g [Zygosaccharomyces rouxii]KAH9200149.1 KptA family-domain-containing protein [Zygosaccharomyces rouxii]GAV47274.1 hypothetical protein ZYGR_0H01150 [Zygosaccharomyces rouxii]CAR26306.1 ZYRO0B06600p [Zygosaccharomyces rouxii]